MLFLSPATPHAQSPHRGYLGERAFEAVTGADPSRPRAMSRSVPISVPISVVIAAHAEDVLGRSLDALLSTARPTELEIVVVCNGCTDRTVEFARG